MNEKLTPEDVIVTALDPGYGGSLYWAELVAYKPSKNYAKIVDLEDGKEYEVKAATIRDGIKRIVKDRSFEIRDDLRAAVFLGEVDADAADCILQAGLFGEIIYG